MKKDFITATPDSGTGGGTVTTTAAVNTAFQDKQTTLNVSGGRITRSVKATELGVPFLFDLGVSVQMIGGSNIAVEVNGYNSTPTTFSIQNGCPEITSTIEVRKGDARRFSIQLRPILLINSAIKSSPYIILTGGNRTNFVEHSSNNGYTLYKINSITQTDSSPNQVTAEVYNGGNKILKYIFNVTYS